MKRVGVVAAAGLVIVIAVLSNRSESLWRGRAVTSQRSTAAAARDQTSGSRVGTDRKRAVFALTSPVVPTAPRSESCQRVKAAAEQVQDILRTPHNVFNTLEDQAREIALSPLMLQQLVSMMETSPTVRSDGSVERLPERIRGFDLLESIARLPEIDDVTAELCQSVLVGLVRRSVEKAAAFPLKEAIVADKHDALAAITHINSAFAVDLYREFAPGLQRQFMGTALWLGLVDLGWERTAAQRYILSIP